MSEFKIRAMAKADVPEVLVMVRELAAFERELKSAVATEADFLKFGFGADKRFEAIVVESTDSVDRATDGGQLVAFALYFYNFSTWTGKPSLYLEDLYVREAIRHQGVGSRIFSHLAGVALENDCERFQWQVLDWNASAIKFYEAIGAKPQTEWVPYRIVGEENLERLSARS